MERADLVYKLVDELEPVLEKYACTGIEIAVLITKVNDNVVGYQGTRLGKDFLEKNTHFTETFRKFCKVNWYGIDNVLAFALPKKIELNSSFPLGQEKDNDPELSNAILSGDSTTVLPISGFESLALMNDEQTPLTSIVGTAVDSTLKSQAQKSFLDEDYDMAGSEYFERKKITRKAKYKCSMCEKAYFRRPHRLNIHMHEHHSQELTKDQLEAYPLPQGYKKSVEVVINKKGEEETVYPSGSYVIPVDKKWRMTYRYYCKQCDLKFKKVEKFNEHREKRHSQPHVTKDYGTNQEGYQCDYCNKVFASRWNLQRHIDLHLGKKKFKCNRCDQSFFRRDELYKHLTKHVVDTQPTSYRGKITCYSCEEPIRSKAGPNCAIPDAHENDRERLRNEPLFKCKTCNKVCKSKVEYTTHVDEHEGIGKEIMSEHDYISTAPTDNNDIDMASNTIEENRHEDVRVTKTADIHGDEMHDGSENGCHGNEDNNDSILEQTIDKEPDADVNRSITRQMSKTGTIVKIDEDLTKERKPFEKLKYKGAFTCDICSKSFVTRFVLKRHMKSHENQPQLKCQYCSHTYPRKDLLERHIKRVHAIKLKPVLKLKCDICYARCKDGFGLRYHKYSIHGIGKKIQLACKSCIPHVTFPNLKYYRKHQLKMHSERAEEQDTVFTQNLEEKPKTRKGSQSMAEISEEDIHENEIHDGNENGCHGNEDDINSILELTLDKEPEETNVNRSITRQMSKTGTIAKVDEDLTKERFEKLNNRDAFTCHICSKSFVTRFVLKRHILSHENHPRLKCQYCSRTYSRKDVLQSHTKQAHALKLKFDLKLKCDICYAKCKDGFGLRYHKYSIHGIGKKIQLTCKSCIPHVTFPNLKYYRRHQRMRHADSHTEEQDTVFKQEKNKTRKRSQSMAEISVEESNVSPQVKRKAVKICQTPKIKAQYVPSETITRSKSKRLISPNEEKTDGWKNTKIFKNNVANAPVKGNDANERFEFSMSSKAHENYSCNKCKKSFRYQTEYHSHRLIHSSKKVYPCTMCCLVFLTTSSLEDHKEKHDKDGNFSCDFCKFQTDSVEHLKRHRSTHNTKGQRSLASGQKQSPNKKQEPIKTKTDDSDVNVKTKTMIVCEKCDKEFSSVSKLKRHEHVHLDDTHRCQTCDRSFNSLASLTKHESVHLECKPFPCHDCGMSFHQHSTLLAHQLKHGPDSMQCSQCPSKFRKLADLDYHKNLRHASHSLKKDFPKQIKCEICGKILSQITNFDRHMKTHKMEKTFSCSNCKKIFTDKDKCRAHEETHTTKNHHKCMYCHKSYTLASYLKTHIKREHHDESNEEIINMDPEEKDVEENYEDKHDESEHLTEGKIINPKVTEVVEDFEDKSEEENNESYESVKICEERNELENQVRVNISLIKDQRVTDDQDNDAIILDPEDKDVVENYEKKSEEEHTKEDIMNLDPEDAVQDYEYKSEEETNGSYERVKTCEERNDIDNQIRVNSAVIEDQRETIVQIDDDLRNEGAMEPTLDKEPEVTGVSGSITRQMSKAIVKIDDDLTKEKKPSNKLNNKGAFTCDICSKSFDRKFVFKRHILTHENLRLKCQFCSRTYSRKDRLGTHMKQVHGFKLKSALDLEYDKYYKELNESDKNGEEGNVLDNQIRVNKHLVDDQSEKDELDNDAVNLDPEGNDVVENYEDKSEEVTNEFDESEKEIEERNDLDNHIRMNSAVIEDQRETFVQIGDDLRNDSAMEPTLDKEPEVTGVSGSITRQMSQTIVKIDGELIKERKPSKKLKNKGAFTCDICSKSFDRKFVFKRHILTHENLRLKCQFCSCTYSRKDLLGTHMKQVHGFKLKSAIDLEYDKYYEKLNESNKKCEQRNDVNNQIKMISPLIEDQSETDELDTENWNEAIDQSKFDVYNPMKHGSQIDPVTGSLVAAGATSSNVIDHSLELETSVKHNQKGNCDADPEKDLMKVNPPSDVSSKHPTKDADGKVVTTSHVKDGKQLGQGSPEVLNTIYTTSSSPVYYAQPLAIASCNQSSANMMSSSSDSFLPVDQADVSSNITQLSPDAQQMEHNVILQSNDNENGPATIYVVHSENNDTEPKVIYVVTDSQV